MRQVAWVMAGWLACVSGTASMAATSPPARPSPPEITWDWYKAGETYLVFANEDPTVGVRVEPCSATAPRTKSEASIAALGQPAIVPRLPALKNRPNH